MLNELIQGAFLVFQWPAFGFLLIGILAGLWLGAVPGLGGALGIVLALPFTYGMEPAQAIALLLGIYAVTATSDPSVLLGIPGTPQRLRRPCRRASFGAYGASQACFLALRLLYRRSAALSGP